MTDPEAPEGVERCGAMKKGDRGPCELPAGFGTDHIGVGTCKFHLGCTRTHRRAASLELARRECARLGVSVEVDPGEALLQMLWEAYGNVAFYRSLVERLPTEPEPDVHVDGEDGGHWERGEPGLYGRIYHISGVPSGEVKPHIFLVLYNDERDRAAQLAAAALKAGVEERRVRMVEADATRILEAQVRALQAIGLGDRLEEFRSAFVTALRPHVEQSALGAASAG